MSAHRVRHDDAPAVRRDHSRIRRVAVLAVLAALVVAALAFDPGDDPEAVVFPGGVTTAAEVANPPDALSSSWFCPAFPVAVAPFGTATLVVTNTTGSARTGVVTTFRTDVQPVSSRLALPAGTAVRRAAADLGAAGWSALSLTADGGGVLAGIEISGPDGATSTSCDGVASSTWYTAVGATTVDAAETLTLFNPFPDNAVIDMTFATNEGVASPQELQAVLVPARTVVAVDLTQQVRRRTALSATVQARVGRIVMGRVQGFDGSAGTKGVSAAPAAPETSSVWWFPNGQKAPGVADRFVVYNPSSDEAVVDLTLTLDAGSAEPYELTIPGRSATAIEISAEERVPTGVGFSVSVTGVDGAQVVVERATTYAAPVNGFSIAGGATQATPSWLLTGAAGSAPQLFVVVLNPGEVQVSVTIANAATGGDGVSQDVAPGGRVAVSLAAPLLGAPALSVVATGPVAVERALVAGQGSPSLQLANPVR